MNKQSLSQLAKLADTGIAWTMAATIFIMPLMMNPWSADLFDLNKRLLLGVATAVLLVLWMVRNMLTRSFRITLTPFTIPLVVFALVNIFSSFSNWATTTETFINTTATLTFLTLIFLAVTTSKNAAKHTGLLLNSFVVSGLVLAVLAILETIGFGPTKLMMLIAPGLQAGTGVFISPAGSAIILIATLIPALVAAILTAFNKKVALEKALYFLASALITAGLVISIFIVLPGKPNAPAFLSFDASWQIAAENIKTPRAFLIGVGPGNYIAAFSANKPVSANLGDLWNVRFGAARDLPLQVFTTMGIVGLGAWIILILALLRLGKKFSNLSVTSRIALVSVLSIVIINLFIPVNTVLTSLFVFLLIILSLELKNQKEPGTSELILKLFAAKLVNSDSPEVTKAEEAPTAKSQQIQLLPFILGVPVILLAVGIVWGSYRVLMGDLMFKKSLSAAAANNGTQTYDFQRQALAQDPYMSSYHRSYASTNLALANAIGSQETLTDQDKQNISQLIEQSIREAKLAVQLNPNDPQNWELLSQTYRALINVADGAVDWANASYLETIRRDPLNPRLRLELGGIYFQLQNYADAIRLFQQASDLKPNWANAYYNLAVAYANNKELDKAVSTYDLVLALVEPNSADYQQALDEQNQLKKLLGQAATQPDTTQNTGELQQPAPLPTPLPANEQVQLDAQQAAPPVEGGFNEVANPTPAPEATTTP